MAGTPEGGRKAAITRRQNYSKEQISEMNRKGGYASSGGGFAWMKKHDPVRFRQIIAERASKRAKRT